VASGQSLFPVIELRVKAWRYNSAPPAAPVAALFHAQRYEAVVERPRDG